MNTIARLEGLLIQKKKGKLNSIEQCSCTNRSRSSIDLPRALYVKKATISAIGVHARCVFNWELAFDQIIIQILRSGERPVSCAFPGFPITLILGCVSYAISSSRSKSFDNQDQSRSRFFYFYMPLLIFVCDVKSIKTGYIN